MTAIEDLISKAQKAKELYNEKLFNHDFDGELENYIYDIDCELDNLIDLLERNTAESTWEEVEREREQICISQGLGRFA